MPGLLTKARWRPRLRDAPLDWRPPAGSAPSGPGAGGARIAIACDQTAAHVEDLCSALAKLGARGMPFRLADCAFDPFATHGLRIPGFADALPDAVFVRALEGGGFEAVTKRLGILHALGALGVPVINSAKAMENCVDKSMTSFLLARHGVATPDAWAVETRAEAARIVARQTAAGPLALKPLFGSQGRGLRLIRSAADLPAPEAVNGLYYLQRFVSAQGPGFWDVRLLMSRGRPLAAMIRRADTWIVNIRQGGRPERYEPSPALIALAAAAAAAAGAVFAGVDIIVSDSGPQVIEVNSTPAWAGLQQVTDFDIAAAVAVDLVVLSARRARAPDALRGSETGR